MGSAHEQRIPLQPLTPVWRKLQLAASALLPAPGLVLCSALCLSASPAYKDVSSIFAARCYGCHAAAVKMGSLNLQTWDGVQQGGTHGKIFVPGKSAESRLFLLISGKEMPAMPMDGSKLSPGQIEIIQGWIDGGAPGPAPGELTPAATSASLPKI